jgi:hypothetical protein
MSENRPSRSDELHDLLTELGRCVQDAVTGSSDVSVALAKIRESGYEPTFVIETRVVGPPGSPEEAQPVRRRARNASPPAAVLHMTALDRKFLRSLKISAED